MNIRQHIDTQLHSLDYVLEAATLRPQGKMLHGVVSARKNDTESYATWQTAAEYDDKILPTSQDEATRWSGLFWGHYDMSKEDAMTDYAERCARLPHYRDALND